MIVVLVVVVTRCGLSGFCRRLYLLIPDQAVIRDGAYRSDFSRAMLSAQDLLLPTPTPSNTMQGFSCAMRSARCMLSLVAVSSWMSG